MVSFDEIETTNTDLEETSESSFEWEFRVMLISAVWTLPGLLFGVLIRLFVPEGGPVEFWLIGGGILGAIAGGVLESDHLLS